MLKTTIFTIVMIIIFSICLFSFFIWLIFPTKKNPIIYKDYRVGERIFTIHLERDYEGDVAVGIFDWHLPPKNRFEYIKQFFTINGYNRIYWRTFSSLSLEEFIIQELHNVIKKEKEEKQREKEWEDFIKKDC